MIKLVLIAAFAALLTVSPTTGRAADAVKVVAAENVYGDVARQVGGPYVAVTSILSNPDQDPHLFEASPSVARDLSAAKIVIYSGADYDPWMEKLLGAASGSGRTVVVAAALAGRKAGDNPHIWYDLVTMVDLGNKLALDLTIADPAHAADYQKREAEFAGSLQPIAARITEIRKRLAGRPVTATEPVFGYMFDALGLKVRNKSFQLAVMNNTEPSASDVAAFEDDLKAHKVDLLVYNSQASDPIAEHMVARAKAAHIPVVAATETEPAGKTYQQWMMDELGAIDHALPK